MKIGITGLIVIVIMLAMVTSASAFSVDTTGQIEYANNGTPCPAGWTIYEENLNRSYPEEPWDQLTFGDNGFIIFDYQICGRAEGDNEYIRVWVESPDKRWFGEKTAKISDVWNETWQNYIMDIAVEEQTLPTENHTQDMLKGWNMFSLPLTPTDNNVSVVLSGVSDVVYRYNATSKQFECPSTMDPGIGYFVHVTTPCTWEYEGTPVTSTSSGLKSGLNMIGVPNCTMSVSDAMGSADYRYVARWNAADQEFEVYNPSAPVAFHGFTMMAAGEGYFVSAKSDDGAFAISCPG